MLFRSGLFQGQGEDKPDSGELVFDLGGNVAEWGIEPDGKGKLLGGSADRAADPKARAGEAAEAYRGFRVLRGEPKQKKKGTAGQAGVPAPPGL